MTLTSWISTSNGTPKTDTDPQDEDNAEDSPKTPDAASSFGGFRQDAPLAGEGDEPPKGTRHSTATDFHHSERITRQRKSLPRLDTAVVANASNFRQADLPNLSLGVTIKDPAASRMTLRATNPDPISSPTVKGATTNQTVFLAQDLHHRSVSEACTIAHHCGVKSV